MPRRHVISLPILRESASRVRTQATRWSRVARWRTGCLIAIHLLILGHMIHWWVTGRSVGRFVLSDSMRTLELGEVNPGFVLFCTVILATALFGRFFCGWLCHMGALQDLCSWLLRRIGIRPRLFRSRLLGFVPLGLALYMFVWPTLQREAVVPMLESVKPGFLQAPQPFPGLALNLTTRHIWEGLPSAWVAVPFLLLCGFGTVYFLGARGLCRYGCPYGGFLLPVEQLAPARVVVDPTKCDQCGLCTKACTAGVRVHDQVRLFGAITDRNCIKSLDCIEACPSNALTFRATMPPSPFRRAQTAYDLTWIEEFVCTLVFMAVFLVSRGLYGVIPMLLAATIAVLAAFLTWKVLRMATQANVRLGAWVLLNGARATPAGIVFLAAFAALAAVWLHSAAIRGALLMAERADDQVTVSLQDALQGRTPPEQRETAATALRWYRLASPVGAGGFGLTHSPDVPVRVAWAHIVMGRKHDAETSLRAVLQASPSDSVAACLGMLLSEAGRHDESITLLRQLAVNRRPWKESRRMYTNLLLNANRQSEAESAYRDTLRSDPKDVDALMELGRVLLIGGRTAEGIESMDCALRLEPESFEVVLANANALLYVGRVDDAADVLAAYARRWPATRHQAYEFGANMLASAGRREQAAEWREHASQSKK